MEAWEIGDEAGRGEERLDMSAWRERRRVGRLPVADVDRRIWCRILPGGAVTLIDVSAYGLQLETALPLAPGRMVHLQIGRVSSASHHVDACVIRCAVTALCAIRGPVYRVGVLLTASLGDCLAPLTTTGVLSVCLPVEERPSSSSSEPWGTGVAVSRAAG